MMKTFFSKLLLFGEYGLMFGAKALAVPFPKYQGSLSKADTDFPDEQSRKSAVELERFTSWFRHEQLNMKMNFPLKLDKLQQDVAGNLFFRSTIPPEYGVGSSGALCAALFHDYSIYEENFSWISQKRSLPEILKNDFSMMESYFHGSSSGLDPLVSFLNQPVLFENKHISLPCLVTGRLSCSVHLVDTGTSCATSPLVRIFLNKMEDPDFRMGFRQDFLPANNGAVDAFLSGQTDKLFHCLRRITRFQLQHFSEMIPASFIEIIESLMDQDIYVKLLGSGGGGFLLAFVPEEKDNCQIINGFQVF